MGQCLGGSLGSNRICCCTTTTTMVTPEMISSGSENSGLSDDSTDNGGLDGNPTKAASEDEFSSSGNNYSITVESESK